ncbi:MAG: GDYXXLXY domain-containing protein, partial [Akkermansia sp.]|nr:GDYXXLXY domain-containing protein [Akkermansia sp.]
MRIFRYFLLILIVAAQAAYLVYSYLRQEEVLANSPVLKLRVKQYDPRDLFRGNYCSIDAEILEVPLSSPVIGNSLYWEPSQFEKLKVHYYGENDEWERYADYFPEHPKADSAVEINLCETTRLAVFWAAGDDGIHVPARIEYPGSAEDSPREDEIRTLMDCWARVDSDADPHFILKGRFIHSRWHIKYFISDDTTPDKFNLPQNWHPDYTLDLAYRSTDDGIIPLRLFIDGKPYADAMRELPAKTRSSKQYEPQPVVIEVEE